MFVERLIVALILLPLAGLAIYLGGWAYTLVVIGLLGIAAWEYWRMVRNGGYSPSLIFLVGGVIAMALVRQLFSQPGNEILFNLLILIIMAVSVLRFEQGGEQPAINFALNIGGLVYLGWIGSYLISLRNISDGLLWITIALPSAWVADIGAYLIGTNLGRHRLAPRVSPRKSWEGYLGGLPFAIVWGAGIAFLAQAQAPAITPLKGAILGLAIGITAPMGDLFESLLKRHFGLKDTSRILPGHGGIMDRIDSTLWTGVVSYFLITLFML